MGLENLSKEERDELLIAAKAAADASAMLSEINTLDKISARVKEIASVLDKHLPKTTTADAEHQRLCMEKLEEMQTRALTEDITPSEMCAELIKFVKKIRADETKNED